MLKHKKRDQFGRDDSLGATPNSEDWEFNNKKGQFGKTDDVGVSEFSLEEAEGSNNPDNEEVVRNIEVTLGSDHLSGQFRRYQETNSLSDSERRIVEETMTQLVRSIAEEQGKNWSEEVIQGVSNLVMAMFIQEENQQTFKSK